MLIGDSICSKNWEYAAFTDDIKKYIILQNITDYYSIEAINQPYHIQTQFYFCRESIKY